MTLDTKELKRIERNLHDWEFFQEFTEEELEKAIMQLSLRRINEGEVIFEEKDPGDHLLLLLEGKVEISVHSHAQNRIIAVLDPGSIVGEMSMLDDHCRSATARALEDTELLILTKNKLMTLLEESPNLGVKFLLQLGRIVSLRLRKMVGNLAEIS